MMVTVTMVARYDGGVGEWRQPRCGRGRWGGCNDHQSLFSATFSKHFKLFRAPCPARYPAVGPKLSQVCAIGANSAPLFRRHLSSLSHPSFPFVSERELGPFYFFFFFFFFSPLPLKMSYEPTTGSLKHASSSCSDRTELLVIKNGHQKRPRAAPRDTIKRTPAEDLERECC